MVCDQNGKMSDEFAVCLALRFWPKNVEFGGMSQALERDGLIPNRPLGLVIKGLGQRLETFPQTWRLPNHPPRLPALCSVSLVHKRKSGLKVLSLLPFAFKGTACVTYSRFR